MSSPLTCPTCGAPGALRFCPSCGQRQLHGRHTLRRFGRDTLTHFVGEEGLVHTAWRLTLAPGRVITDYLAGRTVRYLNPIGYLLVTAAAFALVGSAVGGSTGAPESDRIWALLIIPFVALASRVLNWRGRYNLAEHLIIVTFLSAHVLALLTLLYFGLLVVPASLDRTYAAAALHAAILFYLWGYSHALPTRRILAALAGVASLVLGSAAWLVILMLLVRLLRH